MILAGRINAFGCFVAGLSMLGLFYAATTYPVRSPVLLCFAAIMAWLGIKATLTGLKITLFAIRLHFFRG